MNLLSITPTNGDDTQQLLMQLDFYEEAIIRTLFDGKGKPCQQDEVGSLEVAQALAGVDTGTGLLPPGVLYHRYRGSTQQVAVYLPPRRREVKLNGGETFMLPTPPLVFAGHDKAYRVAALVEPGWPDGRTPLYHAPFPNLYTHTVGMVCHGGVIFPEASPQTIYRAVDLFFDSQFNRDLGNGKSVKYPHDITRLWASLSEQESYPLEDLVATNVSLEEWLR